MKFTIVLPVRNGGEYVKECVKSILAQTVTDFTVAVLDNASTDGTLDWIRSQQDSRIAIYPSTVSLSIEENWSRITKVPRNEFMTIIGHDDKLDPDYLSVMSNLISKFPDSSLYQAHFRFINAKGGLIRKCRDMNPVYSPAEFISSILTDRLDTMGTGYMMRSADFDTIGGMPSYPNLLFADHALWLNLASKNSMAVALEESFSFRLHQSTSKTSDTPRYISAFKLFLEFLDTFKQGNQALDTVIKRDIGVFILFYGRSLTHRILKTPENQRNGMDVASVVAMCNYYLKELSGEGSKPIDRASDIRFCKLIDKYAFLRRFYLLIRRK
jgi:glycosyltransferase involved in cell wall biosynthesis